jgi:hypothetical protein
MCALAAGEEVSASKPVPTPKSKGQRNFLGKTMEPAKGPSELLSFGEKPDPSTSPTKVTLRRYLGAHVVSLEFTCVSVAYFLSVLLPGNNTSHHAESSKPGTQDKITNKSGSQSQTGVERWPEMPRIYFALSV